MDVLEVALQLTLKAMDVGMITPVEQTKTDRFTQAEASKFNSTALSDFYREMFYTVQRVSDGSDPDPLVVAARGVPAWVDGA